MGLSSRSRLEELFPLRRPPPEGGYFEIGLVLGGTVSAGAYTAGALDFLLQALEAWHRSGPPHQVRIPIVAGASGGGVCATILGLLSRRKVPHVTESFESLLANTGDRGNPLFSRSRIELARCLERIGQGDTLVVVRIDRLARSLSHLLEVIEHLRARGAHFRSLGDPIDTTSPQGIFTLQVLGAAAELERALIRERTRGPVCAPPRRVAALAAIPGCGRATTWPSVGSRLPVPPPTWLTCCPASTSGCRSCAGCGRSGPGTRSCGR
jgi:Resolvase, N terminal domain